MISRLTLVWLFTIVVLPFVTQLLSGETYDLEAAPLYDRVLLVSALALAGMGWWGRRHPELLQPDSEEVRRWRAEPVLQVTVLILLVALVLSVFVPSAGMWPLLGAGAGRPDRAPGAQAPAEALTPSSSRHGSSPSISTGTVRCASQAARSSRSRWSTCSRSRTENRATPSGA